MNSRKKNQKSYKSNIKVQSHKNYKIKFKLNEKQSFSKIKKIRKV